MSTTQWPSKVVPAQLSFLAIYNPSLGPTDETFRDQLVFYYSRAAHEARQAARRNARNDAAGGDALRTEENEKLRQIGLAQGMVDFARSFSDDEPVDSVETDKSRIVLYELEKGWWILASIDLTRLPSLSHTSSNATKEDSDKSEKKPAIEYSSREVSPPALLIQQLLQAHYIFCLHHGPSLSDLFVRLTRDKFCNTLERYWARFCRNWDVLLHGSPATDIFSGLKLASGGELGFGVGEEEWGSGEREVLEDLTRRTEGMIDLVVARFGEPAPTGDGKASEAESEALPWMGSGNHPIASDGVLFGGVGALQRHSVRDVSLWMRQIYTYGEQAYGVRDNPLRERRKRRRRNPPEQNRSANGNVERSQERHVNVDQTDLRRAAMYNRAAENDQAEEHSSAQTPTGKQSDAESSGPAQNEALASRQITDGTSSSGENQTNIPPPIVSAAEQSLRNATRQAEQDQEPLVDRDGQVNETGTTLGIPDQYMKYLTFGLSTLGKPTSKSPPATTRRPSSTSSKTLKDSVEASDDRIPSPAKAMEDDDEDTPMMTRLEPIPDGDTLKAKIATRKRQENRGHFVIGLKGDLLELDELPEEDETDLTDGSMYDDAEGSRIVLRTIQVEIGPDVGDDQHDEPSLSRRPSHSDIDPANESSKNFRRVRVLIYVHRPFMYCFLFKDRTSSLQWTKFYKTLHRNLVPIHKPLLSSTSVAKVAQRIEDSHALSSEDDTLSVSSANKLPSKPSDSSPIFDLIYDPRRLTLHTSIPNIAEPGTPAAEGIFSSRGDESMLPSTWTRIDALNVHSQILNTLSSVRSRPNEIERMSKTSRGWWVVWMKVAPSETQASNDGAREEDQINEAESSVQTLRSDATPGADTAKGVQPAGMHRTAFLVRKAADTPSTAAKSSTSSSRAVSSMLGVMSLGMAYRDEEQTGGSSAGWGPAALTGGIGIDARKYVEGLLSLNR